MLTSVLHLYIMLTSVYAYICSVCVHALCLHLYIWSCYYALVQACMDQFARIYIYIYICVCVCVCMHMCVCVYVYMCVCVCVLVSPRLHGLTQCLCTRMSMYTCVYVCMYIYIYIYICINIYIHTYIYMRAIPLFHDFIPCLCTRMNMHRWICSYNTAGGPLFDDLIRIFVSLWP
jgi:hypothetical protein